MTHQIQNFDVKGGPQYGRQNLPKIREALDAAGLDGFIIPHEDEYNNEYLPDYAERLSWATGFTGSAGAAIVMKDRAAVFVDGRYTAQVKVQVDGKLFDYADLDPGVAGWIREHARKGERIGYDPRLHSPDAMARIQDAADRAGAELVSLDTNLIDRAWDDQPEPPRTPVSVHPVEFAGEDHESKRTRIGDSIKDDGADAAVLTDPTSIAWLLNVRGNDVERSPLPLASVILEADGRVSLFIEPSKLDDEVRSHLGNAVSIRDESEFADGLAELASKTVRVDPGSSSVWVFDTLKAAGAKVQRKADPVALPKACKNAAEVEGSRQAHVRDGAAIVRFLHWLDTEAQSGDVDEITAAQKLEEIRKANPELKDLSFETISGAGPNGAHPHYRVNTDTNLKLEKDSLYLVDSGGQYRDGTTDITRTVPIGQPTAEMRRHFTLVLKGHIALSRVRFPQGITGSQLDALAREPLWAAGLDYDHGTGHGVGSYLGVHEGPQRISKALNAIALKPGMILSNEPGFYLLGSYGIRIENLQVVTEPEEIPGGDRKMLGFETLTMAPIHKGLIDTTLLSPTEMAWLDAYHATVRQRIAPLVDGELAEWLEEACRPLTGATP
ncbi:aminopeptidase P family protein [Marinicauda pacifica]|jgi:Xaa-Pro aminopeptidase|uniref:aminopeptidase P family protein n=1 Tax=Marinicauda pacifica TaxID=1133559 RepID=UPI0035C7B4AF